VLQGGGGILSFGGVRDPQFSVTREPQTVEKTRLVLNDSKDLVSHLTSIHSSALTAPENELFRKN